MSLPAVQFTPTAATKRLSALGQRWVLPDAASQRTAAALQQSLGLPALVAGVLAQRGFTEGTEVAAFLNPRLEHLPDPLSLRDMDKALAVLLPLIQTQQPLTVFGDYDVDGACATAMLARYFGALRVPVTHYIPDRLTEGYGPNPAAMRTLATQGTQVLLTVDTGTNAHEALAEAAKLGMQVVVTDHHPPHGPLPQAAAIVNPQRADCTSPLQGLCGSGVVFFMLMALNRALRQNGFFTAEKPEPKLTQWLDLTALATVADVMPLIGANRVLVAKGLQQLATGQNVGLNTLLSLAGAREDISAYTLGFVLGPRLNAAGRIDTAEGAIALLLAETEAQALPLAQHLHDLNQQRQALEKTIQTAALAQAEAQLADPETLALVLHAPEWHPGVVGIVASRVKEKTGRPAFVLGTDSNGHCKGSGRSAAGLNLGAAVEAAREALISGGGHAAAAGVTLEPQNLAAFRRLLNEALWAELNARPTAHLPLAEQLAPTLTLASSTSVASLAYEAGLTQAEALAQLAPFGQGFAEPVFHLPQVVIQHVRAVGADGSHLRVRCVGPTGGPSIEAMAFGAAHTPLGALLQGSAGKPIQLAVTLKRRTFNGKPMVDVFIKDAC